MPASTIQMIGSSEATDTTVNGTTSTPMSVTTESITSSEGTYASTSTAEPTTASTVSQTTETASGMMSSTSVTNESTSVLISSTEQKSESTSPIVIATAKGTSTIPASTIQMVGSSEATDTTVNGMTSTPMSVTTESITSSEGTFVTELTTSSQSGTVKTTEAPVTAAIISTFGLASTDDGTSKEVQIEESIPVFNAKQTTMHVSVNGLISLGNDTVGYTPRGFPTEINSTVLIAPFWLDLDLTNATDAAVYVTTYKNLQSTTNITKEWGQFCANDFNPNFAVEVVWSHVPPFPANVYEGAKNVSFKTVILTDGDRTYLFFDYGQTSLPSKYGKPPYIGWQTQETWYNFTSSGLPAAYNISQEIGNTGLPGKWKFELFSAQYQNDSRICRLWMEKETSNPISRNTIPSCPCSIKQAEVDLLYKVNSATNCAELIKPSPEGYGLRCCYHPLSSNMKGSLKTGIRGPSQFYRYHPSSSRHQGGDLDPRDACCSLEKTCEMYFARRPVPTCESYVPPVIATVFGTPHIQTFDGLPYTFPGSGEFTMMNTEAGTTIQGRMEHPWIDGDKANPNNNATVFTAFAMTDTESGNITIQLNEKRNGIEILVDGQVITSAVSSSTNYKNSTVYKDKQGCIVVIQPTDVTGTFCEAGGALSAVFTSPRELVQNASGLLGSANQNKDDDWLSPTGNTLPLNATDREIWQHLKPWRISSNQSLFSYPPGKTSQSYIHSGYVPAFLDEQTVSNDTFCRADESCLYDFVVMSNPAAANRTVELREAVKNNLGILGQYAPPLSGNIIANITVNVTFTMYVTKPSSNMTVNCTVIDGANCTSDNDTTVEFYWVPTSIDPVHISFVGEDDKGGVTQSLDVMINMCDCRNNGTCRFDRLLPGQNPQSGFRVVGCDCLLGWTGHFCELDFNGCEGDPCGGRRGNCTDLTPEVHRERKYPYECSLCPAGFQMTGYKCHDVDECFSNSSLCGGKNQRCVNTEGSYKCVCDYPYTLNGTECVFDNATTTIVIETTTATAAISTATTKPTTTEPDISRKTVALEFEVKGDHSNRTVEIQKAVAALYENTTGIDSVIVDTIHFDNTTNKTKITFKVKKVNPIEPKDEEEVANVLSSAVQKPLALGGKGESLTMVPDSPYINIPLPDGNIKKVPLGVTSEYRSDRCAIYRAADVCKNNGNCTVGNSSEPLCICLDDYSGLYCQVPRVYAPTAATDNTITDLVLPIVGAVIAALCILCFILAVLRKRSREDEVEESDDLDSSIRPSYGIPSSIFLPRFSSNWRQFSGPSSWTESIPTVHRTDPLKLNITYPYDNELQSAPGSLDNISIDMSPDWCNHSVLDDPDFFIDRPMFNVQTIYPHNGDSS